MQLEGKNVLVITANILLAIAIAIFAVGFFPHKAVLPGLATWPSGTNVTNLNAPFDRVIFMVVDALRSDFVYGNRSEFRFTQSLIRSGAAVPFTGHASPPTITMPRVKAITTGSVPSFIDLILNFAESDTTSTLATQDSWLAQLKAKADGELIMFGDDTWLRLFPGFFTRSDGTTSFFVSDFTEVDHNVTRNVPSELEKDDWSAMVLHYLGLDHIGHKTGPQGPNMPAKQREMDGIVKQIYSAMEQNYHLSKSLLVLLGDHGMNEAGNHGASSSGETSTALSFISPRFKTVFDGFPSPLPDNSEFEYYDKVEQSDIAATLAALLGFPIPKNSLGIIMARLLTLWDSEADQYRMLFANAQQMQAIAQATFPEVFTNPFLSRCDQDSAQSDEQALACNWQKITLTKQESGPGGQSSAAIRDIQAFLKKTQSILSGAASKYDLTKMATGIVLALASFLVSSVTVSKNVLTGGMPSMALVLSTLVHGATMFASSYVEEEHQFWYWSTAAWLVVLAAKRIRSASDSHFSTISAITLLLLLFGVSRRWNQTGQKYAGEPDIANQILNPRPGFLWIFLFLTYATISRRLARKASKWGSIRMAVFPVMVTIIASTFKLAFTAADAPELLPDPRIFGSITAFATQYSLVSLAQISFLGFAHMLVTALFYETPWKDRHHKQRFLSAFHDILSLFLVTQTRTANIPLLLLFYSQAELLGRFQNFTELELAVTTLLMQNSSFFMFGGTNAISSVDLSNAYNGVSGYNVLAVGILTFTSNWVGPIWWTSVTSCSLSWRGTSGTEPRYSQASLRFAALTWFATGSTLAVMIACMVLREHLFIWTVFSPKYLYVIAWIYGQHIVINGVFGTLILG